MPNKRRHHTVLFEDGLSPVSLYVEASECATAVTSVSEGKGNILFCFTY